MSSATFTDGRRTRAVMSLLARGLGSLSFGKVLLGAMMLWMAAAFISIGGGSVQQAEGPVTVELVGYVDQNPDGQDNGTVVPPPKRTGGAYNASPTATAAIPVSKPTVRQPAANTTGTGDQGAVQRPRLRTDSAQPPSEPEGLRQLPRPRANAAQPASTGTRGGSSAGRADELMGGVVDLVSGVVSTVAGKKAGDQARQGLTGITDQVSTALRAGHRLNTSGESGSGNMSTAAKPGTRERATQTNTDTGASPALPAGHKTNQPDCASDSGCTENGRALTGRKPTTQPARGPPSGRHDDNDTHRNTKHQNKISKLANGFVSDLLELVGKAGGQNKSTSGSANQGGGSRQASTGHNGGGLGEQISGLVENFVSNVLKLVGGGQGNGSGQSSQGGGGSEQASAGQGGDLGEQITQLTGDFVQNLLKLVGVGGGGQGQGSAGGGRSGQGVEQEQGQQGQPEEPVAHRPRPGNAASGSGTGSGRGRENVDQLVNGVVDLVSGVVGTVAGKKAGAQARQALSGLADEVSEAIAAGRNGLDSRGRGMGGSNTSTPVGSGHDGGSPSTPPDEGSGPITCQAIGVCPSQGQPTKQRAGAPQARGPPAEQTSTPTAAKAKPTKAKPADKPAAQPAAKKKAPLPKGISKAQAANAEKIVKAGQKIGIPKRGLQVALATAFQESGLRNLRHGDRDSLGLFQQRPSQGWGSKAQVLNPTHAATEFFKHLKKTPGWQKKSITQAAQAVQRSALPNAYAKWAKKASALVDHVIGTGKTSKKDPKPQPASGTGSGKGTGRQDSLAGSIQELTGNFVTNLLDLLGVGQQGGQQGGQPGGQGDTGGGSAGTGGQAGGQDGGWSLGAQDGQFAGTQCQSETECALAGGGLQTRQPSSPLAGNTATSPDQTWWNNDGSATEVNRALNNRLAVLKGQKGLDKAKDQLEAKKITKAAYQKKAAAQKALQTKADRSMGQLSPDDQTLIKDTIGDQRKLATAKTKLDAERKQLAAGKLTKATYKKHAAAYNKQADAVEAQTTELYEATGRTSLDADPGRNGAGAACSKSGAFGECSTAAIDPKTGKLKEDQSLCMLGISGCSSSAKIGNRVASAGCDPAKGCTTTSRAGKTTAKTKCGAKDCDLAATADETGPHTYCQAGNGRCDNNSSERHTKTEKKAKHATTERRALSGTANCRVAGGQCTAATSPDDENGTLSYVDVNCQTKGCKGTGATATKAAITAGVKGKTATRTTSAHHTCTVGATTGACSTDSSSTATRTEGVKLAKALTASSRTTGTINCASTDCKGSEKGFTTAGASGDVKAKDSKAATRCQVHGTGGTCGSATDSEVSYRPAHTGPGGKKTPAGIVSVSHADSQIRCQDSKTCGGKARTETSARDLAVSKHWRGASTDADCTVRNGGCQGQASSDASTTTDHIRIDPKTGKPLKGQPGSGPTATSRAAANVDCQSKNCTGTAHTASAAWDGAVNNGKPRTSQGSVKCAAGASSCQVQTLSNATTGPGATTTYTDKPNPNRLGTGPSAASTIGGKMTGSGHLTGDVTATNPSVSDRARGNKAESYCNGTGGTCTAVINGAASTSPDANTITPMVADQPTQNATTTNTPTGDTDNSDQGNGQSASGKNTKTSKNGKNATASKQNPNQPGNNGQRPDQPATAPGSAASSGGPTIPGASSWTTAWANLNCNAGAGPCKGTPHSTATGLTADKHNTSGTGNKGPPHGTANTTARCNTTGSACQATTSTTAGTGQVVADILTERNKNQATQQLEQAKNNAQRAKQAAATPGATAKQRKAATSAAKTLEQAKKAAAQARKPVKNPPATLAQSEATAQCAGPGCKATTTGEATTSAALSGKNRRDPATASRSRGTATCTAGANGCAVTTDSTATTELTGARKHKAAMPPGRAGSTQVGSSITCPGTGCTGKVTGNSASAASPDGGTNAAIRAATARKATKAKGNGPKTDPTSVSVARGGTACTGQRGGCEATITTTADTAASPKGKNARFATTNASAAGGCQAAGKGCPVTTSGRTTGTDAPGTIAASQRTGKAPALAKTTRAVAGSTCANKGGCQSSTGGFASDHTAEVTAGCAGKGCRTRIDGTARHGANKATTRSNCTAAGGCAGAGRVGASPTGAETLASCAGGKGARCSHSFSARSAEASRTAAHSAKATAGCGSGAGAGSGWCATNASARTAGGAAQAAAACRGSKGSGCHYSYRAGGSASAGNGAATARAAGYGSGRFGAGQVATSAQAQAGNGAAQAAASCQGSKGTHCTHHYAARTSASDGGGAATAHAAGSGGGGTGGGWTAVSAQAKVGNGAAQAAASCAGSAGANCSHSYRASVSASAPGASANAHGSGGGGKGSGWTAVSAQASGGPGHAQAAASCSGSAGTSCSHHYQASASASARDPKTGSSASANASGSGGGGMGGGGVSVTASAWAKGNQANASASCDGAPNCSSRYTAHAEQDASATTDKGRWDAHGEGTCSGTGNGGCGVVAHAVPGGHSGAECTTANCPNFTEAGSYDHFTPAKPKPRAEPGTAGKHEGKGAKKPDRPLTVEEAMKQVKGLKGKQRVALGAKDENGDVVLITRDQNGKVRKKIRDSGVVTEPNGAQHGRPNLDDTVIKVTGDGGQEVSYDPTNGTSPFKGSNPTGVPGKKDTASSDSGFRLARDGQNTGSGWVRGNGRMRDGLSGTTYDSQHGNKTTATFKGGRNPKATGTCTVRCTIKAPDPRNPGKLDVTKMTAGGTYVGRTKDGAPARVTFEGKGSSFRSAEGDKLTLDKGVADIVTRNGNGLGGHMAINGIGKRGRAEGMIDPARGGGLLVCQGCRAATHYMSTAKGKGGTNVCSVSGGSSKCLGIGAKWNDLQEASVGEGKKGSAEFVQFLRNADGSGGGAVGFAKGDGKVFGSDHYGNHIEAKEKDGKPGGMSLLYAEADGYNSGQSCTGECHGSAPESRRLRWVNPGKDVTEALGMTVPGKMPKGMYGPPVPVGSQSLRDRAKAVFKYTAGQGHTRWMAEVGNKKLAPMARAIEDAKANGTTPKEREALAKKLAAMDPKIVKRGGRTFDAIETILKVDQTRPHSVRGADAMRQLAKDPKLVSTLNPKYKYDPDKPPTKSQITTAKNNLLDKQDAAAGLRDKLDDLNPELNDLRKRRAAHNKAVEKYNQGLGGNREKLEAEEKAIDKQAAKYEKKAKPLRDKIEKSQTVLQGYDLAAATAGGDRSYARDIALARRNLASISGFVDGLPTPKTKKAAGETEKLVAFSAAVAAGYEATINAPRAPDNRLRTMQLPSSGAPDLALSMRAAAGWDYFKKLRGADDSPLANKDGSPFSDDQLADVAATWSFGNPKNPADLARLPSVPKTMEQAVELVAGPESSPEHDAAVDAFFKRINIPNGIKALKSGLPEDEQGRVDDFLDKQDPKSVKGFFQFVTDGVGWTSRKAVKTYNQLFGYGGGALRSSGRTLTSLATSVFTFPETLAAGAFLEGYNTAAQMDGKYPERLPGQDKTEYEVEQHPIANGLVKEPLKRFGEFWGNGPGHAWNDLKKDPLQGVVDATTPLLLLSPFRSGFRSAAAKNAAKADQLQAGALRPGVGALKAATMRYQSAAFEAKARGWDRATQVVNVPLKVAEAPYVLVGVPGRAAALGVRGLAVPGSRLAHKGGEAAGYRALGSAIKGHGPSSVFWAKTSGGLNRASKGLARTAETSRMIARHGRLGAGGVAGAYNRLGERPSATRAAIDAAYTAKSGKLREASGGAFSRPGLRDPVRAARHEALDAARTTVGAARTALAGGRAGGTPARPSNTGQPGVKNPPSTGAPGASGHGSDPSAASKPVVPGSAGDPASYRSGTSSVPVSLSSDGGPGPGPGVGAGPGRGSGTGGSSGSGGVRSTGEPGSGGTGAHSTGEPGSLGTSGSGSGTRSTGESGGGGTGGTGAGGRQSGGTGGAGPSRSGPTSSSGSAPHPPADPASSPARPAATGQVTGASSGDSGGGSSGSGSGRGGAATAHSPAGKGAPRQPGAPKPDPTRPSSPSGPTSAGGRTGPTDPTPGGADSATGAANPGLAKPGETGGHPTSGHAPAPSHTQGTSSRGPPPSRGSLLSRLATGLKAKAIAVAVAATLITGTSARIGEAPKPVESAARVGQERVLDAPSASGKGIRDGKLTPGQGAPRAKSEGERGPRSPATDPAGPRQRDGSSTKSTNPHANPHANPRSAKTTPNHPSGPNRLIPLPVESVPFRDPWNVDGQSVSPSSGPASSRASTGWVRAAMPKLTRAAARVGAVLGTAAAMVLATATPAHAAGDWVAAAGDYLPVVAAGGTALAGVLVQARGKWSLARTWVSTAGKSVSRWAGGAWKPVSKWAGGVRNWVTKERTLSPEAKWRLTVATGTVVMVGAVVAGTAGGLLGWAWLVAPPAVGALVTAVRGMVLTLRDDTQAGISLTEQAAQPTARGKAAARWLMGAAIALFATRVVSVDVNAAAAVVAATVFASMGATLTWLAHAPTGWGFEQRTVAKTVSGLDKANPPGRAMPLRWAMVRLKGVAYTWLGLAAVLTDFGQHGMAGGRFSVLLSLATMASMGFGTLYMTWDAWRTEVGSTNHNPVKSTARHMRVATSAHNLPLVAYGFAALAPLLGWWSLAPAGVVLSAGIVAWLKNERGPPVTLKDAKHAAYITGTNVLAGLAGWAAWRHGTGWTVVAVAATEAVVHGASWLIHRLVRARPNGPQARLARLERAGAPHTVVEDLRRLVEEGKLTNAELGELLGWGRRPSTEVGQLIGDFAVKHGLGWTKKKTRTRAGGKVPSQKGELGKALEKLAPRAPTKKDDCACLAEANAKHGPGNFDPTKDVREPGRDDHDSATVRDTLQRDFNGFFKKTSARWLNLRLKFAKVGTRGFAWGWDKGSDLSHLVYWEKTKDGVFFHDRAPDGTLRVSTKAPKNTRLAMEIGSGKAGRGRPAKLPPHVGANTSGGRVKKLGDERKALAKTEATDKTKIDEFDKLKEEREKALAVAKEARAKARKATAPDARSQNKQLAKDAKKDAKAKGKELRKNYREYFKAQDRTARRAAIQAANAARRDARTAKQDAEQRAEAAQQKVDELKTARKDLKQAEKDQKAAAKTAKAAKNDKQAAEARAAEAQTRVTRAETARDTAEADLNRARTDKATAQTALQNANRDLADADKAIADAQARITSAKAALDRATANKTAAEDKRATAERAKQDAETRAAEARDKIAHGEPAERTAAEAALSQATKDRKAAEKDLKRANNKVNKADKAIAEAPGKMARAEAALTRATGKKTSAETERATAEKDKQDAETRATDARTRFDNAETARTTAEADRDRANDDKATAENTRATAEGNKTAAASKITKAKGDIKDLKNAKASVKRANGDKKAAAKASKKATKLQRKTLGSMRKKWNATIGAVAALAVGSVGITATGHGFVPQYPWAGGAAQILRGSILSFRDSTGWGRRLAAKVPHAVGIMALTLVGTRLVSWNLNAATAAGIVTWLWAASWATVLAHTTTAQRFEAPRIGKSVSGLDGMNPHRPWHRWNGFLGFAGTWAGVGASLFALATTGLPHNHISAMITVATLASQGFGVAYLNWHFWRESFRFRTPNAKFEPVGLLLHDMPLAVYGLNALMPNSPWLTLALTVPTGAAITMIRWAIQRRGPPELRPLKKDWHAFAYVAGLNLAGGFAGWQVYNTHGPGLSILTVVGVEAGILGATRLAVRFGPYEKWRTNALAKLDTAIQTQEQRQTDLTNELNTAHRERVELDKNPLADSKDARKLRNDERELRRELERLTYALEQNKARREGLK